MNGEKRWQGSIDIRVTGVADLENIQRLWATPEVMCFVGFPQGLHETMEHLSQEQNPFLVLTKIPA